MTTCQSIEVLPRRRRHTFLFLRALGGRAPVHLQGRADVTGIHDGPGPRASVTAHVVAATAAAVAAHPEANGHFHTHPFPMTVRPRRVDVKVTFDVTVDDVRCVRSAVLVDAPALTAVEVGDWIRATAARLRAHDAPSGPLALAPTGVGRALMWIATRPGLRHRALGTVAVTSLAHRPVTAVHSDGGTTVTVGVGRPTPEPVVVDGAVRIRDIVPLSLTFDHRAIDGALAADVLADLTARLEETAGRARAEDARRAAAGGAGGAAGGACVRADLAGTPAATLIGAVG